MLIDKNPDDIKNMFDRISSNYDFINDFISFFTHRFAKKQALGLLTIPKNANVLDLCCGTGDIAREIKRIAPCSKIIGGDFSSQMLEIAKSKSKNIIYKELNALELPFNNNEFDIITIAFGLRNIQKQDKAISEIYRVLKPNGQLLHLDFEGKSKFSIVYDKFVLFLLRFLIKDITPYEYLMESKNKFYNSDELIEILNKHGFKYIKHKKMFLNMISYHLVSKD